MLHPLMSNQDNAKTKDKPAEKKIVTKIDLLMIANQIIQEHEDFLDGMRATDVEEKAGVLVFKGEYFLNEQGLPTMKTTAVFNMFKYLAHHLSKEFSLVK